MCTPLMKTTEKTSKNHGTTRKICKHGVSWKKVKNEQWQAVISRRDKQCAKKVDQASMLSLDNSHNSRPKNIVEAIDRWEQVRLTMDSGAAGPVVFDAMFPRVQLERKT